ncbi:MAG: glycosyl hydrolase family 8 [Deltaproteobacteria bacterium]|nr:glycosyl hydrolase family 8 [Deltaproteobacteria bacterium]
MKMRIKLISLVIALSVCNTAYGGEDAALWERYKTDFISEDGRVIDYHQNQISHSEGQGYGMMLAVIHNDRAVFDSLWLWTKNNIKVRTDNLFTWSWGKRYDGQWSVIDYNNATDGDILIAYSLLKAYEKWNDKGYKNETVKIIEDIRKKLAITWQGHTFLLPSYYGFVKENGFVLNPSYFIFPAFRYFAEVDDRLFWEKVYKDSLFLITQSCFGKLCLPADWVILKDEKVSVYENSSSYFGAEAIRVLLYMSSEKKAQFPKGVDKILEMYKQIGYLPSRIDLEKDSFSLKPAPAGYYAVYALAAKNMGDDVLSKRLFKEARERLDAEEKSYYSFNLYLLAVNGYLF